MIVLANTHVENDPATIQDGKKLPLTSQLDPVGHSALKTSSLCCGVTLCCSDLF